MELKETLLMPKTDFPMRGNLPNREPQIEQSWYDEKRSNRPSVVITGPCKRCKECVKISL